MTANLDFLIDSIHRKLKGYEAKEIYLEKKILKKFILSLLKEEYH